MLISLAQYAAKNNRTLCAMRQKCLRNGFKTAKKIGRNWVIDEDEPMVNHSIKTGSEKYLQATGKGQSYCSESFVGMIASNAFNAKAFNLFISKKKYQPNIIVKYKFPNGLDNDFLLDKDGNFIVEGCAGLPLDKITDTQETEVLSFDEAVKRFAK